MNKFTEKDKIRFEDETKRLSEEGVLHLVTLLSLRDLKITTDLPATLISLVGGGALPYRIGRTWYQHLFYQENNISYGLYKKHR